MKKWINLCRKLFVKYCADVTVKSVVPHTMITAGSGHGKDMFGERLITQKIGKYKVIDFYSDSREEGFFYSIPADNAMFNSLLKKYSNDELKPKGFKSEIYMILGKKIFQHNELPENVKVVTLDENDFKGEDVIDFLAGGSNPAREVLTMMFFVLRENKNIKEPKLSDIEKEIARIRNELKKKKSEQKYILENYQQLHYMTIGTIYRNIIKIRESGIFESAEKQGYKKLSIKKVLEDPNTITTFSLQLLENEMQKAMALGMLAKKVVDFKKEDKELSQVLMYMREIQKFYEKRDDGLDKYYSMLRNAIYYMLTEGRDTGIILYANAQDFDEQLPGYVKTHFQMLHVGRQSKKAADKLQNWANIPYSILNKIPTLEPGVFMTVAMGNFYYPVFSPPTMHKKKEAGFNVMSELKKIYGEKTWCVNNLFDHDFKLSDIDTLSDGQIQSEDTCSTPELPF